MVTLIIYQTDDDEHDVMTDEVLASYTLSVSLIVNLHSHHTSYINNAGKLRQKKCTTQLYFF